MANYYFVGGRGNGKSFESLKRYLEILQQPSSITVSKDCIPEIIYKKNVCQDDFPEINIDSIRRMMKEEEFKMIRPRFKLGDKVMFCGHSFKETDAFLGCISMITGVAYDHVHHSWMYEITKEEYDGSTTSIEDVRQGFLAPYVDYTTYASSRYIVGDIKSTYEIFKERLLTPYLEVRIEKAIFNPPYTIVIFSDKSKSIVKCDEGDTYDPEKGLALALCKKGLGTNKSGSNYYDIFKKFLPKENTSESHARAVKHKEEQTKKDNNPCNDCADRKKGCLTNCEKMQAFVNDIQDTEESPKPIEPGYFVRHAEERKNKPKAHISTPATEKKDIPEVPMVPMSITNFVERFDATMFPSNFIAFCRKNNLYFFIVDKLKGGMKAIDPYTTNWQQVTRYLKSGVMESCKKMKYHKNTNSSFLAVDMDRTLFAKLPVELRGENRKEV